MPLPTALAPLGSFRWDGPPRFALSPDQWGIDAESTNGLTYGYVAGTALAASGIPSIVPAGTVLLADNATNYVERTYEGLVSANQIGFTSTSIPMAIVVTAGGEIASHENWGAHHGPFPYFPITAAEAALAQPPVDIRFGYRDIRRWGGSTAAADNSAAIAAALASLPAEGATVDFPEGAFHYGTPLTISTQTGVTFTGRGARYAMNFVHSSTRLVYTGTGATNAFTVSTNFARNFRMRDMSLEYSSGLFTGHLLYFDTCASVEIERVYLGGPGVDAGSALYSAASCIAWNNASGLLLRRVYLTEAKIGLYGVGGEQNHVVLDNITLGDFTDALIDADQATGQGWEMRGCMYNPIRIAPANGVILAANGFEIHGFQATGTVTSLSPTGDFFKLTGRGEIHGGNVSTDAVAIRLMAGGVYAIRGLRSRAKSPLIVEGGTVTSESNDWVAANGGAACVSIVPGAVVAASVNMRGDQYENEAGTAANSIAVGHDSTSIRGTIVYDANYDSTANGPSLLGENVQLQQASEQSISKTANYTLTVKDTGQIFNNIGATGAVVLTLPPAKRGLKYELWKFTNQSFELLCPGTDKIMNAAAATVGSLTNNSNEIGAILRVRCVTSTQWLVEFIRGTWV